MGNALCHTLCACWLILNSNLVRLSLSHSLPQLCVCVFPTSALALPKEQALQINGSLPLSTIINVALSLRAPNRSTPGPTSLSFSPVFHYTALWPSTPPNTDSLISTPSTTLQSCIISRCPWCAFVCTLQTPHASTHPFLLFSLETRFDLGLAKRLAGPLILVIDLPSEYPKTARLKYALLWKLRAFP